MAALVYSAICSLDGYVADADGNFGALAPDSEVHAAVNDVVHPLRTHLYGRRLYEVMAAWETLGAPGDPPEIRAFGERWRAADKVVYTRTLQTPTTARTSLERGFDAEAVRQMKASSSVDMLIGGPSLAGQALSAGLVDRVHLFLSPVSLGGGLPALPRDVRLDLVLHRTARYAGGVVHLTYEPRRKRSA